jgi:hypothetical protein
MTETRDQQRAVCPLCFAQHAITAGGRMVAHGYTRPQGWHANVGDCAGVGRPHFGTEKGRSEAAYAAQSCREQANDNRIMADRVRARVEGEAVLGRKSVSAGRYIMAAIDAPTDAQREAYARHLLGQAAGLDAAAIDFETRVAAWVAAEPVAVKVEKKTTLVHWRHGRHGGKACAASYMGAHKGFATSERENVTCEKCRAIMARHDERAAAKAVQQ